MKKYNLTLYITMTVLMLTSLTNLAFSFDKDPRESFIVTEECDDEFEDTPDGSDNDWQSGFMSETVPCPGDNSWFPEFINVRCCIFTNDGTSCDFSSEENPSKCRDYRARHPEKHE